MATAIYRRYRPETFAEMIGQSQVTDPLMTALRNSNIGHAYLFSGPRGCGKTTSARVLARCLNCHNGPTDSPCGTCPSCIELGRDGGGSLDVIEIDAASHGGVDDARDLRERAVFAPARDRYKIFIIDEAHMVTKEGFNALLKIVEEPPAHVKFVFATTEPEKVIGTIRSRTHHYPFRLVAPAPLLQYVADLCAQENVQVEEGVLSLAVRAGGGSVRDTLSILDQLIAGSESNMVTYDRAVGLLGFTPEDLLDEIIDAFAAADAASAIGSIDRVIQTGQDPRRFVEDLLERLRDLIIVQATEVAGAAAVLRGMPEDQLTRLFEQAEKFDRRSLSNTADIVSSTLDRMTGATSPRLHLELMTARVLVELSGDAPAPTQAQPQTQPQAQPQQHQPAAPESPAPQTPQAQTAVPAPSISHDWPATVPPVNKTAKQGDITFAEAAKNARAFLANTGATASASAQRSPAVETPAREVPVAGLQKPETAASTKPVFSFEELEKLWSDFDKRLAPNQANVQAAAAQGIPMSLEGSNLKIGFTSPESFYQFRDVAADPVRALIKEVFGVEVKYLPKQIAQRPAPAVAEAAEPAYEQFPEPPEEYEPSPEPHHSQPLQAPDTSPAAFTEAVPAKAQTAQAVPVPSREPEPVRESDPVPAPEPVRAPEPEPAPKPTTAPFAASAPAPAEKLIRYGESVVREQLGARFLREEPLQDNPES